ncbi:MAG: hypothetical protein RLZ25_1581 [Pseudomonadota bacterium]|jgi:hypothetical protein
MTLQSKSFTGQGQAFDPNGKSPHEPGAKLDSGKMRADLLVDFSSALKAAASIATFGANKYTEGGWITVPDGVKRYRAAFWRHLLEEGNDPESGMPHEWHALWNLMALIELQRRGERE